MFTVSRTSWWFVWLTCVLSVGQLASPVTLLLQTHEMRCESSDPVDSSEEVNGEEVALIESSGIKRRMRCHRHGMTRIRVVSRCAMVCRVSPQSRWRTSGQVSLQGRCGPLHC